MLDRIRAANVDDAAENPPLLPLAGAAIGAILAGGGILWFVLSFVVDVPIPVGNPFTTTVIGLVLFVVSMLAWSPEIEYS